MHKNYFIFLSCQFMCDMIGFLLKHANAYFIAKAQMQFSKKLVQMIFSKLDY